MDINCAWCSEPWEVQGLRHDGWEYLSERLAGELDLLDGYAKAHAGDKEYRRKVSQAVYKAVLSGKGCCNETCGFIHQGAAGPYREQQLMALVFDSVTDDDPAMFM